MNTTLSSSQKRAAHKIARMINLHGLSLEDVKDALALYTQETAPPKNPAASSIFITALLGYLGGALIVSGLFIYASMIWDSIGGLPRVLLSLGAGLVAFYVGSLLQNDEKTRKASLPLWLLSALLIPTGFFVFLHEYTSGNDPILGGVIVFAMTTLLYWLAFRQHGKMSLLCLAILFGMMLIGTFYEYIGLNHPIMWLATGLSFLLIGQDIHRTERYAEISFLPLGFGCVSLTASAYYYLGNTGGEGLMASTLLAMIFMGYRLESRTLVFLATSFFILLIGKYNGFSWGYRENDLLRLTAAGTGISMLFTAQWIKTHTESSKAPIWNFLGSSLLFSACMGLLYQNPYDVLFPIVPGIVLVLSLRLASRALLLSSILSLLSFISYYTTQYFANTVGWPIALMVTGLAILGLCIMALKMNTRIKASPLQ